MGRKKVLRTIVSVFFQVYFFRAFYQNTSTKSYISIEAPDTFSLCCVFAIRVRLIYPVADVTQHLLLEQ